MLSHSPVRANTKNAKNIISINRQNLKQGDVLIIKSDSQKINKIIFNGKEYRPNIDNDHEPIVLIPISYWLKTGDYKLKISGDNYRINETVEIQAGEFRESYITVDNSKEEMVRPRNSETIERIKKDNQLIIEARETSSGKKIMGR